MEPRLRASPEQFSILIDFMERRGDISKPQTGGAQGRVKGDRLWQELTSLLNSVGGGVQKSSDKWKKVWADWKTKTKKKYLAIRRHVSGTGGGPSSRHSLTALEERVVAVIGVSAVTGQACILEQGFNRLSGEPPLVLAGSRSSEMLSAVEEGSGLEHFVLETNYSQNTEPILLVESPPRTTLAPARETSTPPPQPAPLPAPPPRTPPARSSRRQASASPLSAATTPNRRSLLRARRNRVLTPFDRATSEFVAVEHRRLEFEERRDRRHNNLELARIEVNREHNQLLHQLALIGQRLIDVLAQQRSTSLPSTDILSDTARNS